MKTFCSVSGGQSSAYIAAHYNPDVLMFALVCIDDPACAPKDKKLVQRVSDKIGREFIATAEDDTILHTMLDLEQYTGKQIHWVVGPSFDHVCADPSMGGYLPSGMRRYCTIEMKLRPMFEFWRENHGETCFVQIGFRFGEEKRAERMVERCDDDGVLPFKGVVGVHADGVRRKWKTYKWQIPTFPLIENGIRKDHIVEFWKDKPVRFAPLNNCVGCFHRNPILIRQMFNAHPEKMEWFARQERGRKLPGDLWNPRSEMTYDDVAKHRLQLSLPLDEWENDCDSGHCGL
jgi:hypothetical protein